MGRPINKRFFGSSTTEGDIRVRFRATGNGIEYDGYILKQKGSKKFLVSAGNAAVTSICTLAAKVNGSLAVGDMTIRARLDSTTVGYVSKIEGRTCVLVNTSGTTIGSGPWSFASSLTDGFIQLEESQGMAATAIRGNATIVSGNVDL